MSLTFVGSLNLQAQNILPLDQIKPGMKGYGLTVFRGTEPEKFEVEVIDILHGFRPTHDLILVRTTHPILENAKTVAGMSGSPIYIQNKLIGAYAYGWSFGKDPIAGVTPIEAMLKEMNHTRGPDFQRQPVASNLRTPNLLASNPTSPTFTSTLALSGFSNASTTVVESIFKELGFKNIQTTSGHQSPSPRTQTSLSSTPEDPPFEKNISFKPGSAIAVTFMRGDLSASSIGTVTHVDGDRLIAFGHPMMDIGKLALPTAAARILHVLASQEKSFKIGEIGKPQGALIFDRPPAIVVDPTQTASTLPVSIETETPYPGSKKTWKIDIAKHKILTPALVLAALAQALHTTASDVDWIRYHIQSDVAFENQPQSKHKPFKLVDEGQMKTGTTDIQALRNLRFFEVLSLAMENPYAPLSIKSIRLIIKLEWGQQTHTISQIRTAQKTIDPDQWVDLHVELKPYQKEPYEQLISVYIPKMYAGKTIELSAIAGDHFPTTHPIIESLEDALDHIENQSRFSATSLIVMLESQDQNLRTEGTTIQHIPASTLNILQTKAKTSNTAATTAHMPLAFFPTQHLIEGSSTLSLRVRPYSTPSTN